MADEIKIRLNILVETGSFTWSFNPGQISVDQAAGGRAGNVQSIGTTEEAIDGLANLTAYGYAVLRNLDATNYIDFGPEDDTSAGAMIPLGRLKAGEFACLRLTPGVALMARASAAACLLDVTVLED